MALMSAKVAGRRDTSCTEGRRNHHVRIPTPDPWPRRTQDRVYQTLQKMGQASKCTSFRRTGSSMPSNCSGYVCIVQSCTWLTVSPGSLFFLSISVEASRCNLCTTVPAGGRAADAVRVRRAVGPLGHGPLHSLPRHLPPKRQFFTPLPRIQSS